VSVALSTAEVNQRKRAALASAARRRGTGTKDKNPLTPHTQTAERLRRRSNQDAPKSRTTDQGKTAVATAIESGRPVKIVASQFRGAVTKLKEAGYTVKTQGDGTVGVTLKSGKTLILEAQT